MKTKVGVLYGGIFLEHEISLASARTIKKNLNKEKYEIIDLFINKSGQWFLSQGKSEHREKIKPANLSNYVDIVVSVLHGSFGEDGSVQKILEDADVKFIGSNSLASFVSFSKIISKKVFQKNNIPTPEFITFCNRKSLDYKKASETIREKFGEKAVIKTSESGSSFGVYVCKSSDEFIESLKKAFAVGDEILVEEYIVGQEYTCGVLEAKNDDLDALPIVEIIPKKEFFDFEAKYNNQVEEICPAIIKDKNLEEKISALAISAHKALGLSNYSRTDFIVRGKELFTLETNTLPGMTETSLYPQELKARGISIADFLDKMIKKKLK